MFSTISVRPLPAAALLCLAGACALSLYGQAVSGTIYGVVRDSSGAAIAGARVSVVNVNTNYTRSQSTRVAGDNLFASLPLGQYTLTVEQSGFDQFVQEGITLQVDQQIRLEATLRIGKVAEKVSATNCNSGAIFSMPSTRRNSIRQATRSGRRRPASSARRASPPTVRSSSC